MRKRAEAATDGGQAGSGEGRKNRRNALVVAGIGAGALVAGSVLGSVVANSGWPGRSETPPHSTASGSTGPATEPADAASTPAASSTSSPSSAQSRTLWRGKLTLTRSATDLDVVPPDNAAEYADVDVYFQSFGELYVSEKSLRWTGEGDPTEQECVARLRTNGLDHHGYKDDIEAGERFCITTDGGRTASLRFITGTERVDDGYRAEVEAVVWGDADG